MERLLFLGFFEKEKILGNFCFSEQIFYRKESLGAPGLDKNGSARRDSHDDYDPSDPTRGSIYKSRKF